MACAQETVRVPLTEVDEASSWSGESYEEDRKNLYRTPAEEEVSEGEDGLSHHGDPDQEVEVIEDPSSGEAV